MRRPLRWSIVPAAFLCLGAAAPAGASVDYGPISHSGFKKIGATSTSVKLPLQLGLDSNMSDLRNAVEAASKPTSSSYGKYSSLSNLQSKWGATKDVRNGVVNAFKAQGVTATVDVTHLRASATISVGKAQKLFGTKWNNYRTSVPGQIVALPVNTPKLPSGLKGNTGVIAGLRYTIAQGSSSSARSSARKVRAPAVAHAAAFAGGT